jgi:hypothetical protein
VCCGLEFWLLLMTLTAVVACLCFNCKRKCRLGILVAPVFCLTRSTFFPMLHFVGIINGPVGCQYGSASRLLLIKFVLLSPNASVVWLVVRCWHGHEYVAQVPICASKVQNSMMLIVIHNGGEPLDP